MIVKILATLRNLLPKFSFDLHSRMGVNPLSVHIREHHPELG
jgi:hypothetical protein